LSQTLRAGHPDHQGFDIETSDAEDYTTKVCRLKHMAERETDAEIRKTLTTIHAKSIGFRGQRNHLAHALLWCDRDERPIRKSVPSRDRVADHNDGSPEKIRLLAEEFNDLGEEMAGLAAKLRAIYRHRP
jgi:hypothetical protein